MADSVGQIGLDLVVNQGGFNQQMKSITGLAKKAGSALAAAFAVKKLVNFSKQCIDLGSDLAEVQNVVDVTFTSMSDKVNEFAQSAASSFGLSETMAKRYTGIFGAMAKAFGFTESAAYDMSTSLTGLAGDVASFYNITQDEAYTKLKSVFTGETESLKDLGVVMTQTALDQFALANGFGKTTAKMSEAEKVSLRYAFVQQQLATASGDFARTSDGWANQVRILSLQFDSLKASIGQGLINVLTPVIKIINSLISKLQVAATAFKNFTDLVAGKSSEAASSSVASIGAATQSSVAGIENSSKAASKAAKKAASSVTSLDELNIINPDDSGSEEGGSSPGADTFAGLTDGAITSSEEISSPLLEALNKVKKVAIELGESFKTGFVDTAQNVDLTQLSTGLESIKNTMTTIATDENIWSSASDFANAASTMLGSISGTVVTIGTNIATNLVSGISTYLEENVEFISGKLQSLFNTGTKLAETTTEVSSFLSELSTLLTGETATTITANFVDIFTNGTINALDFLLQFASDAYDTIVTPFIENKEGFSTALDNLLEPLSILTGTLKDMLNSTWKVIFDTYDEYIKPAFESFTNGLTIIVEGVLDAYNTYLAPVIKKIATRFDNLVKDNIQPLIDAFIKFSGSVIDAIAKIWEFISPFVSWIVENVVASISLAIDTIWTVIEFVIGLITNSITLLIDVIRGIIDFLVGVFTGDWDKAWGAIKGIFKAVWEFMERLVDTVMDTISNIISNILNAIKTYISRIMDTISLVFTTVWDFICTRVKFFIEMMQSVITGVMTAIKTGISGALDAIKKKFVNIFTSIKDTVSSIFKGIWDTMKSIINSILGGIEKMCNGVIRGVNKISSAMNSLSFDVPDWVPGLGGKSLGFNLPTLSEISIPKLAQGGYVKANTPQLAMIGDNKTQGEIVAPEGKLLEMAKMAAQMVGQNDNSALLNVIISLLNDILQQLGVLDRDVILDGRSLVAGYEAAKSKMGYQMKRRVEG